MKNTKPIENYKDLSIYNKELQKKGLPQYEIEGLSASKDTLTLRAIGRIVGEPVSVPLMKTLVDFVTDTKFCFVNTTKLSRIDYHLLLALAFPDYFQTILGPLVSNLFLMNTNEIELGKVLYTFSVQRNSRVSLSLKEYNGRNKTLYLPSFVDSISENAFRYKKSPECIVSYAENFRIGNYAFYASNGIRVIITPHCIKNLGVGCFENCRTLKQIRLDDSLTIIPEKAFRLCKSLEEIKLPKELRIIDKGAFSYSGITHIDFSDCTKLKKIEAEAFFNSTIEKVEFKNCVKLSKLSHDSFAYCLSLSKFDMGDTDIADFSLERCLEGTVPEELTYSKVYRGGNDLEDLLVSSDNTRVIVDNFPNRLIRCWLSLPDETTITKNILARFMVDIYKIYKMAYASPKEFILNGMTIKEAQEIYNKN